MTRRDCPMCKLNFEPTIDDEGRTNCPDCNFNFEAKRFKWSEEVAKAYAELSGGWS